LRPRRETRRWSPCGGRWEQHDTNQHRQQGSLFRHTPMQHTRQDRSGPTASSSFARSYASDFSPGAADGCRGGATGALSPPTTHDVHLAPPRLRAPNLSCHLQLIRSRRHEHSDAATAWYWLWQPIRAVAVRPSYPCQTAISCCSVRAQRSFESPTRCRKVVGPLAVEHADQDSPRGQRRWRRRTGQM